LTLPFAAFGALIAALIETSIAAQLPVAGVTVDLVLVLAISATLMLGAEDGLVWAFPGGLLLDMLTPGRPLGATTISLLLVVGLAIIAGRAVAAGRRWLAVGLVFLLTWAYQACLLLALAITENVALTTFEPRLVLTSAILNSLLAVPAVIVFGAIERRFVSPERADW
jgi:rod shape-determining protein MreD